jgi:hypothetical protein
MLPTGRNFGHTTQKVPVPNVKIPATRQFFLGRILGRLLTYLLRTSIGFWFFKMLFCVVKVKKIEKIIFIGDLFKITLL